MPDTDTQPVDPAAPDANLSALNVETPDGVPPPAPDADPSPAVPPKDDASEKPKGVQKRLDELTRNWRESQRQNEALLRILESQGKPAIPEPQALEPSKTLADFGYDEAKYQAHLFQVAETRAVEAAKRELQAQAQRETQTRRTQTFQQRETDFAKSVDDYIEIAHNPSLPISASMAEAIAESDDGPALAYHLGKNPEIAERLAGLPPIAAAREIGRIEARLAAEREKTKATVVSKAPPPPPKIDAVEPSVNVRPDDPESDKLPIKEWVERRNKQEAKRNK